MNPNEPTPNSNPNLSDDTSGSAGVPPTPPPVAPEPMEPVTPPATPEPVASPNITMPTPDEAPTPITTAPLTPGGEPPKALVSDEPAPKSIKLNNDVKKPKTGLILTIILIVIILAGGGYFAYSWWQNNQTSNNTQKTSNADTTTSVTLSQLSDALKSGLTGTTPSISKTNTDKDTYNVGPNYQATGEGFYTTPSLGSDVLTASYKGDKTTAEANLTAIANVLSDKKLTKTAGNIDTTLTTPAYGVDMYSSNAVACEVSYDTSSADSSSAVSIDLNCSNVADYATNISTIKPLATAYLAAQTPSSGTEVTVPGFGTPTITDSKTTGYKTANVGISSPMAMVGGASGVFYQTSDGTWHFFKATQSEIACSDYNTDDLKKAFLGEACYDSTTQVESTVQI